MTLEATLVCLGYAVGQFASMLVPRRDGRFRRRGAVCHAGRLVVLMQSLQVPFWFSVVPLVVVMLATTLGWSRLATRRLDV